MSHIGLSVFLGGFFIWNLDNVFCSTIRQWRRSLGLPVAFLLEGHGWWHLMTGLGMCMVDNDKSNPLYANRFIGGIPFHRPFRSQLMD